MTTPVKTLFKDLTLPGRQEEKGKGGSKGTLPAAKPGDWYCPTCDDLQFARNATCRRCGTPNPTQRRAGEWNCPGCNEYQFARNNFCRKCGTPRPEPDENGDGEGAEQNWMASDQENDWKQNNYGLTPWNEIPEGAKLFVGHLPYDKTESDLKDLFSTFGPISWVEIHVDDEGNSKGAAWVVFEQAYHARSAEKILNGYKFPRADRGINVNSGEDPIERLKKKGYINNLPKAFVGFSAEEAGLLQDEQAKPEPTVFEKRIRQQLTEEDDAKRIPEADRYQGTLKMITGGYSQKGYGFIDCPELMEKYGRDVFISRDQVKVGGWRPGDTIVFSVKLHGGNPQVEQFLLKAGVKRPNAAEEGTTKRPRKTEPIAAQIQASGEVLPALWGDPDPRSQFARRCPLCHRKLQHETCQCIQGNINSENVKQLLLTQTNVIRQTLQDAWHAFCLSQAKLCHNPEKHTVAFLMGFFRTRGIKALTGLPDHADLFIALSGAKSSQEVLDMCEWYKEGLQPQMITLACLLLCKFEDLKPQDGGPLPAAKEPRILTLINHAAAQCFNFNPTNLQQVVVSAGRLGATGPNYLPLVQAVMKVVPQPKPIDIAHLAKAFSRILGDMAGPVLNFLAQKALPVLKDFPVRKLLQFVNILMKASLDAQDLFMVAATLLAPNVKELPAGSLSNMLKNYSNLGLSHAQLFDAVAQVFPKYVNTCAPKDLTEVAWAYWSVGMTKPDLLRMIGESVTKRLEEFDLEQMEKIECAYGAAGFTVPDEWLTRHLNVQSLAISV